jgi:hypothetical protein
MFFGIHLAQITPWPEIAVDSDPNCPANASRVITMIADQSTAEQCCIDLSFPPLRKRGRRRNRGNDTAKPFVTTRRRFTGQKSGRHSPQDTQYRIAQGTTVPGFARGIQTSEHVREPRDNLMKIFSGEHARHHNELGHSINHPIRLSETFDLVIFPPHAIIIK